MARKKGRKKGRSPKKSKSVAKIPEEEVVPMSIDKDDDDDVVGASNNQKKNEKEEDGVVAMDIDKEALKREDEKKSTEVHPQASALRAMVNAVALIERGVGFHEKRVVARAMRALNGIRKNASPALLDEIVKRYLPEYHEMADVLKGVVKEMRDSRMEVEDETWLVNERIEEVKLEELRRVQREDDVRREKEEELKKQRSPEEIVAEQEAEKKRERERREKLLAERERLIRQEQKKAAAKSGKGRNKKLEKEEAKKAAEKAAKEIMEAEAKEFDRKKREAEAAKKRRAREKELAVLATKLMTMKVDLVLPEIEIYVALLVAVSVFDAGLNDTACKCINATIARMSASTHNRRTLDDIAAQVFFYFSLVHERMGTLVNIRARLLELHRTACLHHDEPSQVVLSNCILRNYLHYSLYGHADKFRLNTKLPDSRSNSQSARYLYYLARINAVQLHYSDAFTQVKQAIRKGPQRGALGFQQAAHKLQIIVRLLMGDIPERDTFRQVGLKRSLRPYFQLTKAVRVGDLVAFKEVMRKYNDVFVHDRTYSLIVRLRHNVIKTGLRKISLSYSRISIKDICEKLHFESEENAEFVIMKAINDGVIDAVIDKDGKFVYSREVADVYSTREPQMAFHTRIEFCLDTYRDAVQALRFPPNYFAIKPQNDDSD